MWILNPTPATVNDIQAAATKLAVHETMHVLVHHTELMDVRRSVLNCPEVFGTFRVWLYQPTGTNVSDRVLAIKRIA